MPYYKITITRTNQATATGIRFDDEMDIDAYYMKARFKAMERYKEEFWSIDVVMLSTFSMELLEHHERITKYRLRNRHLHGNNVPFMIKMDPRSLKDGDVTDSL